MEKTYPVIQVDDYAVVVDDISNLRLDDYFLYQKGEYKKVNIAQVISPEINTIKTNYGKAWYNIDFCKTVIGTIAPYRIEGVPMIELPDEEARYTTQNLDEVNNIPDLKNWVEERVLKGLIDEELGGIIGYVHYEHINHVAKCLNEPAQNNRTFSEKDMMRAFKQGHTNGLGQAPYVSFQDFLTNLEKNPFPTSVTLKLVDFCDYKGEDLLEITPDWRLIIDQPDEHGGIIYPLKFSYETPLI